jgi:hypothetical protein
MACRGWFQALLPEEASAVRAASSVGELLQKLEEFGANADRDDRTLGVDKSWDAMHRVLCGGWLDYVHGEPVLRACVVGGVQLSRQDDWIISFAEPSLVKEVAKAIEGLDKPWFREQYFALHRNPPGSGIHRYEVDLTEEDFEYTWAYFTQVRAFYRRASTRNMAVLFAVDQ